jgi:hypothetical protein
LNVYTQLQLSGVARSLHYSYTAQEGLVKANVPTGPKPVGVVFSDIRFKNEIDAVRKAGGKIYRLTRGEGLYGAAGQHISEQELRGIPLEYFDGVIDNKEWPLEDLERHLLELVRSVKMGM